MEGSRARQSLSGSLSRARTHDITHLGRDLDDLLHARLVHKHGRELLLCRDHNAVLGLDAERRCTLVHRAERVLDLHELAARAEGRQRE